MPAMQYIQSAVGALQNAAADIKLQISQTQQAGIAEHQKLEGEIGMLEKEKAASFLVMSNAKNDPDTTEAMTEIARAKYTDSDRKIEAARARIQEIEAKMIEDVRNKEALLSQVIAKQGEVGSISGWQGVD